MALRSWVAATLVVATAGGADAVSGQDDAGFVWENATELSFVSTGGNASSSTLGIKGTLAGSGGPHGFKLEVGGIRASSDFTTRDCGRHRPGLQR